VISSAFIVAITLSAIALSSAVESVVGMCTERLAGTLWTGDRHLPGVVDEAVSRVRRELPADDPPREDVEHDCQVRPALPGAYVGEVTDPQLVRPGRLEAPADKIRACDGLSLWDRRAPRRTSSISSQAAQPSILSRSAIGFSTRA
jgi:hypothetical protein